MLLVTREYPPFIKGGMCRITEQMIKRNGQNNIDLTMIANQPFPYISKEKINGVKVHRVPSLGSTFLSQLPFFGFFSSLLLKNMQHEFDAIYSNFSPLFCKVTRPLIASFHATRYGEKQACMESGKPLYAFLNYLYIPFDQIMLRKADGIIALSTHMAHELVAIGGNKNKIEIIPSGVDTYKFKPLKPRNFITSEYKILYVGRFDERKGLNILLLAFKKVLKKIRARLFLAGSGKLEKEIRRLATSLSIPVNFLGVVPQESLPALYNSADLFVLPSLYEGMPLAALEAMACGTPTIVSNASPYIGIPRFQKGSISSLEKILIEYLSSKEKRQALSKLSLKISKDFSWDRIIENTFIYIHNVVSQKQQNTFLNV